MVKDGIALKYKTKSSNTFRISFAQWRRFFVQTAVLYRLDGNIYYRIDTQVNSEPTKVVMKVLQNSLTLNPYILA